ncbi:MAG: uncharacterized protein A8A55_0813 [Amphiamblys sp. WSBS2006]|nr:MAG: uncharacterized protein A8A55_0813 [Amphiamblys sp. WSBS2006]
MLDLVHEPFARHRDCFFLKKDGGVLIVSEASLKNEYEEIRKKEPLLFSQRHEVLEAAKQNVLKNAAREVCHSFLLTQDLPNEPILLTEKTTVTLSNIEVSEKLFFVLLEKTKVTIGEMVSIAEHVYSEDCIREHGMARNSPFWLERYSAMSNLALENIERMPPNSIGCSLEKVRLYHTGLINILPKLRINEDRKVEWLRLSADEEEDVAAIVAQKQAVYVGSVGDITLENYAVSILPKLGIHENSEVEWLDLVATKKEHVSEILSQDKPMFVGRVKNMILEEYAVFVFLKMKRTRENLENLMLSLDGDELWREIQEELKEENTAICIEKTEKLILRNHAVNILPALKTKREMDTFVLDAKDEDQVSEVLAEEYKGFSFVGIKEFILSGSAVNLLTKTRIGEDCEVEQYSLLAEEERQMANVLEKEDKTIATGRVKKMTLMGYAVCVITKLRICNDNTMERFALSADEWHFYRILEEGDRSIDVGRIKLGGFRVPEEIRRKLRYTLVDGETTAVCDGEVEEAVDRGVSEVVDGEGKEVLEERSSSQRGNHLD